MKKTTEESFENQELFKDEKQKNLFDDEIKQTSSIINEQPEEEFEFGELSDGQEYKVKFDDEEENIEIKTYKDIEGNDVEVKYLTTPLTIASVRILKPRVRDINGDILPPLETKTGKKYYTSKVEILYEGSYYKSLIPTIRWWVNAGNKATPSFETEYKEPVEMKYKTDITKLYWKFCDTFGFDKTQKDEKKILTQKKFIEEELIGKKVNLKETKSFYENEWRYKIAIDSFIKE